MSPTELEQYLTQFLQTARDANRRYEEAVALEQQPNSALQDILHAAEFAPSSLANCDIINLLHQYRTLRRTAKQELEVTQIFQQWAEEHKQALNKLENALGLMRKILRRQPNDFYIYKTNAVGVSGAPLIADEKGENNEDS
jgi:hypothetical protein